MQKFIDDMIETMKEYDGVGLAADQVHESKQVAVLEVADNPRYPDKAKVPLTVLVNPQITPLSDEMEEDWEGCLSIPDLRGACRATKLFTFKPSTVTVTRSTLSPTTFTPA